MQERRGRQLTVVIESFRQTGEVDAHRMLTRWGITRTATYIADLRKAGWLIRTTRQPGHLAVYHLDARPASWALYGKRRVKESAPVWTCNACGQTAVDVERMTPTRGRGACGQCGAQRMFTLR